MNETDDEDRWSGLFYNYSYSIHTAYCIGHDSQVQFSIQNTSISKKWKLTVTELIFTLIFTQLWVTLEVISFSWLQ